MISLENPTAICSFNWHQDHFSGTFDIRTADGEMASTACLGFGLERVTLALIKAHGFDPAEWPDEVRAYALAMTRVTALRGLDAATTPPISLHGLDRIWPETNCYADLWIELLHAQGLDPHAMLPFVFALDFEGDQWTFFKPQLADLRTLYGIDVQEMTLWRPLLDHALEHLGAGKLLSVEADSWWLPRYRGYRLSFGPRQDDDRYQRRGYRRP